MGFFKIKKKVEEPPKLICRPNDIGSYKCILLASYRNVPIDIEWENPCAVEDKVSESLHFSKIDRFPVIQDGELTICGSVAVLTYLNIRGGAPSVHPRKARVLAMQQYWIQVLTTRLMPLLNDVDQQENSIKEVINIFDKQLADKNHIVGEFSLADIHWFAVLSMIEKERASIFTQYQNVVRWLANIKSEFPGFESKVRQIAA